MQTVTLPFVSVIIPCYRDWQGLRLCLDCLSRQDYPLDRFEILVVNNDSECKPPEGLSLPSNCSALEEAQPGSYAARNKGLRVARGEVFAFTDADCLPEPDWISSAINIFLVDSSVFRIGGAIEVFSSGVTTPDIAFPYERLFALEQSEFVRRGTAITANMFSKKAVFDFVGPFDMTLKSGGDAEWGLRAQQQGYRIIFADCVKVRHPARTFRELRIKNRRIAGGAFDLAKKKGGVSLVRLFLATVSPPIFAMRRAYDTPSLAMSEKTKAIWVRIVLRFLSLIELSRLLMGKRSERR
ncbi:MAG: glycosyltransferase [Halothiobacillaceae bacterium]|nr:glycosyltransferase [Halothiobacillaceae bacterium]